MELIGELQSPPRQPGGGGRVGGLSFAEESVLVAKVSGYLKDDTLTQSAFTKLKPFERCKLMEKAVIAKTRSDQKKGGRPRSSGTLSDIEQMIEAQNYEKGKSRFADPKDKLHWENIQEYWNKVWERKKSKSYDTVRRYILNGQRLIEEEQRENT